MKCSSACVSLVKKFLKFDLKKIFFLFKDGYKFRFNNINNCGGKTQVVTIDSNFTSSINKKCEVTTSGCVSSKGFKDATMKYTIYKNGVAMMTGNPDLCSEIENHKEAKAPLEMVGFPTECPIEKVRRIKSQIFS